MPVSRGPELLVAIALVALTLGLFAPAVGYGFITFDDPIYVTENPMVLDGLTAEGLAWAWTAVGHGSNWHPLTWVSHMLDVELFGLDARMHHLTSVALHTVNGLLLFVLLLRLLRRMQPDMTRTVAAFACGFLAAVFLIHPQRLESVVWISERKDVLAAFFWFSTLLVYERFTRTRNAGTYLGLVLLLALGLMSKPLLVTLPVIMLLLDIWPLGRLAQLGWRPLLLEKLPPMLLVAASSLVTLLAQQRGGAINRIELLPIGERLGNAMVAYFSYLPDLFWPTRMAIFYPIPPAGWETWRVLGATAAVLALSIFIVAQARRRPWLGVGWAWYLITLLPMIGLIHVGAQARADRYSYIPSLGIYVIVVCAAVELTRRSRRRSLLRGIAAGATLLGLAWATHAQLPYWENSRTLFGRADKITRYNYVALYGMALEAENAGDFEASAKHAGAAVALHPGHTRSWIQLAYSRGMLGYVDEAEKHMSEALRLSPANAEAYLKLGQVYLENGQVHLGLAALQTALNLAPVLAERLVEMGLALERSGKPGQAAEIFGFVLAVEPDHPAASRGLERVGP